MDRGLESLGTALGSKGKPKNPTHRTRNKLDYARYTNLQSLSKKLIDELNQGPTYDPHRKTPTIGYHKHTLTTGKSSIVRI